MSNEKFIYGKNINTGVNYGHIGDSYEGIKQRIFTEEDFKNLQYQIEDFRSKYSDKIRGKHITLGNPGDKESSIYCQQIFNALTQNGYEVVMSCLASFGYYGKNYSVSNAPDDSVLVEVFSAPNV